MRRGDCPGNCQTTNPTYGDLYVEDICIDCGRVVARYPIREET